MTVIPRFKLERLSQVASGHLVALTQNEKTLLGFTGHSHSDDDQPHNRKLIALEPRHGGGFGTRLIGNGNLHVLDLGANYVIDVDPLSGFIDQNPNSLRIDGSELLFDDESSFMLPVLDRSGNTWALRLNTGVILQPSSTVVAVFRKYSMGVKLGDSGEVKWLLKSEAATTPGTTVEPLRV